MINKSKDINYIRKPGKHNFHIHAKCIKCNKIIDIKEEEASQNLDILTEKLKEKQKIKVKDISVVLSGICNECEIKS